MNKWRTVKHTDDGCSVYQCLSCKKQWESRTVPGYISAQYQGFEPIEGTIEYKPHQDYCGFCGIKFDGVVGYQHPSNEYCYGKKRFTIYYHKNMRYRLSQTKQSLFQIAYDYRTYGYNQFKTATTAKICYALLKEIRKKYDDVKVTMEHITIYD